MESIIIPSPPCKRKVSKRRRPPGVRLTSVADKLCLGFGFKKMSEIKKTKAPLIKKDTTETRNLPQQSSWLGALLNSCQSVSLAEPININTAHGYDLLSVATQKAAGDEFCTSTAINYRVEVFNKELDSLSHNRIQTRCMSPLTQHANIIGIEVRDSSETSDEFNTLIVTDGSRNRIQRQSLSNRVVSQWSSDVIHMNMSTDSQSETELGPTLNDTSVIDNTFQVNNEWKQFQLTKSERNRIVELQKGILPVPPVTTSLRTYRSPRERQLHADNVRRNKEGIDKKHVLNMKRIHKKSQKRDPETRSIRERRVAGLNIIVIHVQIATLFERMIKTNVQPHFELEGESQQSFKSLGSPSRRDFNSFRTPLQKTDNRLEMFKQAATTTSMACRLYIRIRNKHSSVVLILKALRILTNAAYFKKAIATYIFSVQKVQRFYKKRTRLYRIRLLFNHLKFLACEQKLFSQERKKKHYGIEKVSSLVRHNVIVSATAKYQRAKQEAHQRYEADFSVWNKGKEVGEYLRECDAVLAEAFYSRHGPAPKKEFFTLSLPTDDFPDLLLKARELQSRQDLSASLCSHQSETDALNSMRSYREVNKQMGEELASNLWAGHNFIFAPNFSFETIKVSKEEITIPATQSREKSKQLPQGSVRIHSKVKK